ncbi:MAG TPA: tyrosine-type recombinase/integrase [Oculatellaceae cyanobacterium]
MIDISMHEPAISQAAIHLLPVIPVPSLNQVWTDFQQTGRIKESTRRGYQSSLKANFSDWLDKPVSLITKNDIEQRHREISQTAPYVADQSMRILKSLINYAIHKYELDIVNPTRRLSDCRLWHRTKRRTNYVEPHQMRAFFDAVMEENSEIYRNFLLFLLLTGCRKSEAAKLRWDAVDLMGSTVVFVDTKNGDSVKLPISSFLSSLLTLQRSSNKSAFVFPGESVDGHISIDNEFYLRTAKKAGIRFTPHDARRTFACVADSLELPLQTIKRLLNHRTNDVTTGYIIHNVERLRKPVEQITHEILRQAGREQLSLMPELMKPRVKVPTGVLETEILTCMNQSSKDHFTVRDVWKHICQKRQLTYDTVRITMKRLFEQKHLRRLKEKPLVVYSLPLKLTGPIRCKPARTKHSIQAEGFWRTAIAEQEKSGLNAKQYCLKTALR